MQILHLNGSAPYLTNSFILFSQEKNAVVIDPTAAIEDYRKAIEDRGLNLKAIFCTHGHFDHVETAALLRKETGAKLYCSSEDVNGKNELYPLSFVDETFENEQIIEIDEMKFRILRTPGHTEGCVCILVDNYLFTGDTIFKDSIGRTDLQGGNIEKLRESCKRIKAMNLPKDTAILPGHGDFSTYGYEMVENFFIKGYC